jgi:hypothetical protein
MKLIQSCVIAASLTFAFAKPVYHKRALNISDGLILNYALTLEFLEAGFYRKALATFSDADFVSAGFPGVRENVVRILNDELAHVDLLQGTSLLIHRLI